MSQLPILNLPDSNLATSQSGETENQERRLPKWLKRQVPKGNIHNHTAKLLEELRLETVCDNAKNDCPMFAGAKLTLHWPFEDPNDAEGSDEEKMTVFRSVADLIHARISAYLAKLESDDCV